LVLTFGICCLSLIETSFALLRIDRHSPSILFFFYIAFPQSFLE
jgi:hypothetical protein